MSINDSDSWPTRRDIDYITAAKYKVVSVLTRDVGFQSIQPSALDALSDLLGVYLERLLSSTHAYAELGNRARPNYYDLLRSLAAASIHLPSLRAYFDNRLPQLDDKSKSALEAEHEPSTQEEVPQFLPSEDEEEEQEEEKSSSHLPPYVPRHLPNFPSKHSFRQTPVYIQRPDDPQRVRELNSQQSRIVEENLKRLMSAENQLARLLRSNADGSDSDIMTPIVNYEITTQRRKRIKRASVPRVAIKVNQSKEMSPLLSEDMNQTHPPPHPFNDERLEEKSY